MKKIIKNRIAQIVFILLVVLILIFLCFFNRFDENIATRVSRVLKADYYKIECSNEDCKYVMAYSGSKKGKTIVKIINSNGKTIMKYNEDYSKDKLSKKVISITDNYIIFSLKDDKDYTHGYTVLNSKGKEILTTETTTLYSLTDKLFYSEKDDLYTIYDYSGNILYKDVKELNRYNNNKILTFMSNEYTVIDEDANIILNGYKILEEVKNDDEPSYLILENNDVYYYFDISKNKIIGDSFNSYIKMNDGELLITKKINNELKKYVITSDGKINENDLKSKKVIVDKITKNVNKDNYIIIEDSIFNEKQKGILVKNISDNSFGTYDLSNDYYNKIFNFNDNEDRILTIYNLYEDKDQLYLEIGCTKTYCNEENIIVYSAYDNNVSFKVIDGGKNIKKYAQYENEYKVVTYSDNTNSLFNKDGEELINSEKGIVVIDEKLIFGETNKTDLLLYSSKEGKTLNDENSIAILDETSNYEIYKYFDEENLYLYRSNGEFIRKISIASSSVTFSDKYMLYLEKNKANVVSLMDSKAMSYNISDKEFITDENSSIIAPYKGSLIISDTDNNSIKIVNYNKKVIKNIKDSVVKTASYDKENNRIFLIIKQNKKYGLYIIK